MQFVESPQDWPAMQKPVKEISGEIIQQEQEQTEGQTGHPCRCSGEITARQRRDFMQGDEDRTRQCQLRDKCRSEDQEHKPVDDKQFEIKAAGLAEPDFW